MAEINDSIYNRQIQLDSAGAIGRGLERGMRMSDMMADRKRQQQVDQDANDTRSAMRGAIAPGADGRLAVNHERLSDLAKVNPEKAYALQQQMDVDSAGARNRQLEEAHRKTTATLELLGRAIDQPSYDSALADGRKLGLNVDAMPAQFDKRTVDDMQMRLLPFKERLDVDMKKLEFGSKAEDRALDRDYKRAKIKDLNNNSGAGGQGTKLSPDKVLVVQEGDSVARMLPDVAATIEANKDAFGPVTGRMSSFNPYNEKSQTIDAQMRASSQSFGKFMEGGVLRKEDEDKYRKMFPNLADTPEVAANKLAIVQKLLVDKQSGDLDALKAAGYNTSPFQRRESPKLPGILGTDQRPKTIMQNGHEYTWNDKSGKYE